MDREERIADGASVAHLPWSGPRESFERLDVTVLLADLRGFTAVAASRPVGTIFDMLDRFLVAMSRVIARNGGTIDKFMGDSIMALFGAPVGHDDDVRRALTCAVEMQAAMAGLNADHRRSRLPEMHMGIGINTGTVMAGSLGSELYSAYTVVGDEVNLASRIESFSLRGQVLISEATFARSAGFVAASPPVEVLVKGRPEPVRLREVLGIPSLGLTVPRDDVRRSPRVAATIPFTYQLLANKIVASAQKRATTLDIGYSGVLAELSDDLASYSDIKVRLDLSLIGRTAADVYAKILHTHDRGGKRLTGIEFTSLGSQSERDIRHFVQLLIQGSERT